MHIIPAIDLKDGQVVRYTRGRLNKKVYSSDAKAVALRWQKLGARFLHLVDLDGAMSGSRKNSGIIKEIIGAVNIPVEVGGGVRSLAAIKRLIGCGVERVILGTKAIEDIDFLKKALEKYGAKIALGLDVSGGRLGVYGWRTSSASGLGNFLRKIRGLPLKTIIYTDISRDGTLKGINMAKIKKLLDTVTIDCVISGGVSALTDIKKIVALGYPHLKGVIVGKALYENRFSLKDAIALTREKEG